MTIAVVERSATYIACETLVANEWRVAGGAVETFLSAVCIHEEVLDVDYTAGRSTAGGNRRTLIEFHADRV